MKALFIFLVFLTSELYSQNEDLLEKGRSIREEKLPSFYENLRTHHEKMKPIQAGDWLAQHQETGQSVKEYIRTRRVRINGVKKYIYVQKIGSFSAKQSKILDLSQEYMSLCFGVEVKALADVSEKSIPKSGQRIHPSWGMKQFYTQYLLEEVLKKQKPKDALCLIAFTATDLYPDPDWNFVFGIARPRDGLGLWSIYRNGDPELNQESYQLCLKRTIKTAIHEVGHLFSIKHCVAYSCVMNGSNSREESDRRELYFCPSCLYKLCGNLKINPQERFALLANFCDENDFSEESKFFRKSIAVKK
jgi:archaemetzincin